MAEKIKQYVSNLSDATKKTIQNISAPFKWIFAIWVGIILILICIYLTAWITMWINNKAVLSELLSLIKEMISPAMMAAVTMMCAFFVDKDNDGLPDKFEGEDKQNGKI